MLHMAINDATKTSDAMPLSLTERNGYIVHNGLKILRGGMGEFLVYSGEACIGVCLSYGAAMAFTNGYAHGKAAR